MRAVQCNETKMSSSPKKQRKLPPRPRITLPVPGPIMPGFYPQTPLGFVATPYGQTPVPMTPAGAGQTSNVLEHLRGFKDWTKAGLSVGEKSAFWLYERVSPRGDYGFFFLFSYGFARVIRFFQGTEDNARTACEEFDLGARCRGVWIVSLRNVAFNISAS